MTGSGISSSHGTPDELSGRIGVALFSEVRDVAMIPSYVEGTITRREWRPNHVRHSKYKRTGGNPKGDRRGNKMTYKAVGGSLTHVMRNMV